MAIAQACGGSVTALYVANKTARSPRRARGSREREQANAISDELDRMARRYEVNLKTEVRRDVLPNEAILAQARRAKYDLLVMGVSRRPGQKLFLGETAAAVLKHAPGSSSVCGDVTAICSPHGAQRHARRQMPVSLRSSGLRRPPKKSPAHDGPRVTSLVRRSNQAKRVLFFLSGGWGPLVRTLPIAKRLADHGIGSSLGIGGSMGGQLRAAGYEVIELRLPAFNACAESARRWWSPYHFLSHRSLNTELLVEHVEAYRKTILDGQPSVILTDINPLAALAAKSLQVPHVSISQSVFLPYRKLHSIRWRMPPATQRINNILARYGAAPVASAEHLEVGEITFIPSIPEFDPMQDFPPTLHYVGPILGNEFIPFPPQTHRRCAARPWILCYPGRPTIQQAHRDKPY